LVIGSLWTLLETARQLVIFRVCLTEVLYTASVSGFDFEVSETDCWHSPEVSVFVSLPGGSKRTRLFQYGPGSNPVPTITSLDDHTVRISLSDVGNIDCRYEKWGRLIIKYEIGSIKYPSLHDPPLPCER
jgi:hypothetical protein